MGFIDWRRKTSRIIVIRGMSFNHLFEEGLPGILVRTKKISAYSPKERKKHARFLVRKMDKVFEAMEQYFEKLPAPASSITCADRIVIFNCRSILDCLSIIFDLEIKSLLKSCEKSVVQKEAALNTQDTSTSKITLKPPLKKRKASITSSVKDIEMITGNILPTYSTFRGIAIGNDILWAESSFEEELVQLRPHTSQREMEAHVAIGSCSETNGSFYCTSGEEFLDFHQFQESLPVPLMESTVLPSRESIALDFPQPLEVEASEIEYPRPRGTTVPHRGIMPPDFFSEEHIMERRKLAEKMEEIMADVPGPPQEESPSPPKPKRKKKCWLKNTYSENPFLTPEEYRKLLTRKPKPQDHIQFFKKIWGADFDKYFTYPKEPMSGWQDVFKSFDNKMELISEEPMPEPAEPKFQRFVDLMLYLRSLPPRQPGSEPPFPLPCLPDVFGDQGPSDDQETVLDTLRGEQTKDLDLSARVSQAGRHIDQLDKEISLPFQEEGQVNLERTGIDLHFPPDLLHSDKGIVDSIPEIPLSALAFDEQPPLPVAPMNGAQDFQDEVLLRLNQLNSEKENLIVKFTDLCSLSESRLVASRTFLSLLGLWHENKIEIHQLSDSPDDIFIERV